MEINYTKIIYQKADKELVGWFLEVSPSHLYHLPYSVWETVREKHYEDAVQAKRELNQMKQEDENLVTE